MEQPIPVNLDDQLSAAEFIQIFNACTEYRKEAKGHCSVADLRSLLDCSPQVVYKARGSTAGFSLNQHRKWTKLLTDEIKVNVLLMPDGSFRAMTRHSSNKSNPLNLRHYVYNFSGFSGSGELKFYRAHLLIDLDTERVTLEHYPDPNRKASHRSRYEGDLKHSEDKVFLTLYKVDPVTGQPGQQMAFNTINGNLDQLYSRSPFFVSTYTTFHPHTGISVLELAESKEEVTRKIRTESIPAHITYILYNRRFEVNRTHKNLLDLQSVENKLKDLEGLQSQYQGFVLYERSEGLAEIVGSKFNIYDTFKVSFTSPHRRKAVTGYIADTGLGMLQCRMNYRENSHHHRATINLKRTYWRDRQSKRIPEGAMAGTYNLLAPDGNYPISGRIILYPVNGLTEKPEDFTIPLSDTGGIEELGNKYPTLLKFLTGEFDPYGDSPLCHEEPVFRRVANRARRGEKVDPTLRSYSGVYFSLRASSRYDAVYMRPVIIDGKESKATRIISADDKGQKTVLSGGIWLIDGQKMCLSFDLQEKIYQDNVRSPSRIQRQTIITIEKGQDYRGRVLEGVTTRVNKNGLPITFREFFFPVKAEEVEKNEDLIIDFHDLDFQEPFKGFPAHVVRKMLAEKDEFIMIGEKSDKRESWLLGIDD